jgi:hypothetical protein
MSIIKLLKIDELQDGTQRFQSQLLVGKDSADFVMDKDGVMKCWDNGKRGFDFYEYKEPYEIVNHKSEMKVQEL